MKNTLIFTSNKTSERALIAATMISHTRLTLPGELSAQQLSHYPIALFLADAELFANLEQLHHDTAGMTTLYLAVADADKSLWQEAWRDAPLALHICEETGSDRQQWLSTARQIKSLLPSDRTSMPSEKLLSKIQLLLQSTRTLCLATATQNSVRATPLEYIYLQNTLYILTEGGEKFAGIWENGHISACIHRPFTTAREIASLQLHGRVQLVLCDSAEYRQVTQTRRLSMEAISRLPSQLFLLKIIPDTYEYLDFALAKEGYAVKQYLPLVP